MHARPPSSRVVIAVKVLSTALAVSIAFPCAAIAQQATDPANSPGATAAGSPRSSSKSSNVRNGEIAALDATGDTLTLRERNAKSTVYALTAKTHYNLKRRAGQRSDFKVGDSVVLHFRKSRSDGALLVSELDDPASWMWLSEVRKNTVPAVIKIITDNTLSVTVGADSIPLDYIISDKTRWEKAGKEVDSTSYKSGDHIYIVPRSLPSGSVMARAIADSSGGAVQEKERMATSVHGTITNVDMAARKLVLKTLTGDTRSFAFSDDAELVVNGKSQPVAALRPGLHVVVRIRHEPGGEELVWRITIENVRKSSPLRKRVPSGNGVTTAH